MIAYLLILLVSLAVSVAAIKYVNPHVPVITLTVTAFISITVFVSTHAVLTYF